MMTNGDIFKAFSDLSRMDKEDFARYVVNNLPKGSRERLLFHLAADFLELILYKSNKIIGYNSVWRHN